MLSGQVLGAIQDSQGIDINSIAKVMDFRQKRMDDIEQKRQEMLAGNAIADAIPNLTGNMKELAKTNPKMFTLVANSIGMPLNDAEKINQFTSDVGTVSKLAMADHNQAIDYVKGLIDTRRQQGQDVSKLQSFVDGVTNPDENVQMAHWKSLGVMNQVFNAVPEKPMTAAEKASAENDKGKLALDQSKFEWSKNHPTAGEGGRPQADVEKYQYWKSLKGTDGYESFGRANGFISKEGQTLSPFMEKEIVDSTNKSTESQAAASRNLSLAQEIRQAKGMAGGMFATMGEYWKENSGNQDEISDIRRRVVAATNSDAIKSLPQGSASDADVKMAREGVPNAKTSPELTAKWLESSAKVLDKAAQFHEYQAKFYTDHGAPRGKNGENLLSGWKEFNSQGAQPAKDKPSDTGTTETAAQRFARLTSGK